MPAIAVLCVVVAAAVAKVAVMLTAGSVKYK